MEDLIIPASMILTNLIQRACGIVDALPHSSIFPHEPSDRVGRVVRICVGEEYRSIRGAHRENHRSSQLSVVLATRGSFLAKSLTFAAMEWSVKYLVVEVLLTYVIVSTQCPAVARGSRVRGRGEVYIYVSLRPHREGGTLTLVRGVRDVGPLDPRQGTIWLLRTTPGLPHVG